MAKKYVWLKLSLDFFDREEIRLIESMPNGEKYILFYMKLLLKSANTEGRLMFREIIPYTEEMLASITNVDIDVVRSAVKMFLNLGLMETLDDGALFMYEVQNMIGCETEYARKKREYREKKKLEQLNYKENYLEKDIFQKEQDNFLNTLDILKTKKDNVRQEKEKEEDKEEDKEEEERKKKLHRLSSKKFEEKIALLKEIILRATLCNEHQLALVFRPAQYKTFIDDLLLNIEESDYLQGKVSGKIPNLQTFTVEAQINRILAGFYKTHSSSKTNSLGINDLKHSKNDADILEML